jgi:hypothetical protein
METSKSLTIKTGRAEVETGLVIKDSFLSDSGFIHQVGVRQFGKLRIIEKVAEGTGIIYLNSILVLDQKGKLVFDAKIERSTSYSRETVRLIVMEGLIEMLKDAAEIKNIFFDELEVREKVDSKLKMAIYETSYDAIIEWAIEESII